MLTFALVAGSLNITPTNASTKSWKQEYVKILNNWRSVEKYPNSGSEYLKMYFGESFKFNRYFLCDVDKNKIPELFLYSTKMGLTVVFTYRNGKLICLGCDDFYKINTSKKCLVVKGHWHGSGGSGTDEYSVYNIGKNSLKQKYYIDILENHIVNNNSTATKSAYKNVYNKYVKGGKKYSSYKKYKLSDKSGLK